MKTARSAGVSAAAVDTGGDPLGEFGSELTGAPAGVASPPRPKADRAIKLRLPGNWLVWVLSAAVLVQLPLVVLWIMGRPLPFAQRTGTVHIESSPPGAQVRVDGQAQGVTPVALSVDAGNRLIELQHDGLVRQLPLTIRGGEVVRQRVEFVGAPAAPAVATRGSISVTTEGARAPVFVDGTARGTSPVVVSDLQAGDHVVSVRFPTGTIERTIRVESGATASLLATMPPAAGALSGWISVDVPQRLQIFEDGRLLGSTEIQRLMLPAGEHTLDLVSDELGFRARRTVRVTPGSGATIPIELPRAPLAINALPWASVWVDGQAVGDTPIGNLTPTIGRHEVVFRHPQLGERRTSVLVTLKSPARVSIDLRRNDQSSQ
jgi:hypothetical protein